MQATHTAQALLTIPAAHTTLPRPPRRLHLQWVLSRLQVSAGFSLLHSVVLLHVVRLLCCLETGAACQPHRTTVS